MKFFAVLFSLYFMALVFAPCADHAGCDNTQKVESTAGNQQDADSHASDNCSPFCICSCCGSICALYHHRIVLSAYLAPSGFECTIQKPLYIQDACISIWHPPKIG